jgi:hydrogenase expression/formation protein HypC
MCVGVPARIIAILDTATDTATAEIGGVRRSVNISCILEDGHQHDDCVGDWVLIHAGFAMARIDAEEASKTLQLLEALGEIDADGRKSQREVTP